LPQYNEKCDIWSCGVILYIILSGIPPFNGASDQEIMKKVRVGKFSFTDPCWSNISDKAKDLITKLLIYDPEQRPSAEDALKHPWIQESAKQAIDSSVAMGALSNLKTFRAD
jgi:calcium-dependent protein kinase